MGNEAFEPVKRRKGQLVKYLESHIKELVLMFSDGNH